MLSRHHNETEIVHNIRNYRHDKDNDHGTSYKYAGKTCNATKST